MVSDQKLVLQPLKRGKRDGVTAKDKILRLTLDGIEKLLHVADNQRNNRDKRKPTTKMS
jgi:hypothetical protein